MTRQDENLQRSLFEEPGIELQPAQRAELAAALEALLREIASARVDSKRTENDSEQNHG
jgi:hypothetical protein